MSIIWKYQEAYDTLQKNKDDLGGRISRYVINLLGISEIVSKNLEERNY